MIAPMRVILAIPKFRILESGVSGFNGHKYGVLAVSDRFEGLGLRI